MAVTIGLPCEVLDVRVRVAPSEHLTPLEQVILRAVGAGVDGFGELDDLFGFGSRMTLDVLLGLWHRGYVRIDVQRGRVVLSPEVARIVAEEPARLQELSPGSITEEIWQVAVDAVAGRVVPFEDTIGRRDEVIVAPAVTVEPAATSVGGDALLAAVTTAQRRRLGDRSDARCILNVELTSRRGPEHRQGRRRYLPVLITASRGEDGELTARVARDEPMAPAHRDRIDRFLAELLESPRSAFTGAIAGQATDWYLAAPSLADRLDRLRERVERLSDAPPGTWADHQHALERLADAVTRELDARAVGERIRLLGTPARQHRALLDAIERAVHQVVLVGPWIDANPLNDLAHALEDALERGVRVYVLWGHDHEDELSGRVQNMLITMAEQFSGRLVFADRSAGTHANVAVCDDRWALVSGLNLMGIRRGDVEAGLVVEVESGGGWSPVEEVLRWARDAYPDHPVARGLLVSSESFGAADEPTERPTGGSGAPSVALPTIDEHAAGPAGAEALRDLWRREWGGVVDDLAGRVEKLPTHVDRLVIDGMHRTVLVDALEAARHRLFVASGLLSPTVVNNRFLRLVEERLRSGTHVRIVYGAHAAGKVDADVREAFARLTDEFGDTFTASRVKGWRANVVVWDDKVSVSSFDFLSSDGFRRQGRLSHRSDLGLSVVGLALADEVTRDVCHSAGVTVPSAPEPTPVARPRLRLVPPPGDDGSDDEPAPVREDEPKVARFARRLIEAAREEQWEVLAERPADVGLQELLRVLDDVRASPEAVADLAPSVLAAAPGADDVGPWADRLVTRLWEEGRFVEAMLVRGHFGGDGSPTAWVTELGAHTGRPTFDEWLGTFGPDDLVDDERTALSIVVTAEVLLPTSSGVLDNAPVALSLLSTGGTSAALPAIVLDHWERHGSLPVDYLERWAAASTWRERALAEVDAVRDALGRWRTAGAPGQASQKIRTFLNRDDSPPGRLLAALAPAVDGLPDRAALAAWSVSHGDDADQLFASVEAAADRFTRTSGRGRVNHVQRIMAPVLASVATLLQTLEEDEDESAALADVVAPVRDELVRALPSVLDAASELPWDLRLLVAPSLERLRRLTGTDRP